HHCVVMISILVMPYVSTLAGCDRLVSEPRRNEKLRYGHIFDQKELNMHQRRWIELFNEYKCEIHYHPGKVNVVADALSRKEQVKPRRVRAMAMTIQSGVRERTCKKATWFRSTDRKERR
nr:putative reverse transcriptase domain-containing protein [Tanacetum cinerariifolium]